MDFEDYGPWAKKAVDWTVEYRRTLRDRPVRAPLVPGATLRQLPEAPPETAEPMEAIWADFERIVPDAMTHWQHPRFMAYFPANAAPASLLAEQLANAMASNLLLWQASPAGEEMETRMVDWLRQALGLPEGWTGLIQDAASTATLCAALTMRERALEWRGNLQGLSGLPRLRVYASAQRHSSVDRAVRFAGIGQDNLVSIPTDEDYGMRPEALAEAIRADRAAGYLPAGLFVTVGGTSIGASDPVGAVLDVAEAEGLYSHVDAAWAGSAMICPEFRPIWAGVERAHSIVFNPHKWLGAQFDCSVQFLRDPKEQIRTLALRPVFLETLGADGVVNHSEWTIPLGRRFRALKLWFLLRAEGLEGLRARIRNHVAWTAEAAERIAATPGLEIVTAPRLALFTFARTDGDEATRRLFEAVNDDGRTYLTQSAHEGRFVIRMTMGQFEMERADMAAAVSAVAELSAGI